MSDRKSDRRTILKQAGLGSKGGVFEMDLPAGETELRTWLYRKDGNVGGAYFTEGESLQ